VISRFLLCLAFFLALFSTGCSSSQLETWHTVKLTEEYRGDKTDDVQSFDDYLELEDRLFEELDDKVYSTVGTGPEYALHRYSRGSASDPESFPVNYNRTFELDAENPRGAVLLIHGMSDSPYSLAAIGHLLNANGYQVLGLRVPGHGTVPAALTRTRWQDMAAAVELAMEHLTAKVASGPVHIIGYSNGAALALNQALDALDDPERVAPDSLVLISPAIGISRAAALAGTAATVSRVPGFSGLRFTQIMPEFDPFRYNSFPTNGGTQTHKLTRQVASRIARLESDGRGHEVPPILVIKSTVDATVSNNAMIDALLGRLPENGHELIVFDINRVAGAMSILVSNPAPFTVRLVDEPPQPFAITFVSNWTTGNQTVVALRRNSMEDKASEEAPLDARWPPGVVSLSHIALPIAPEDPLYGRYPPEERGKLFLGTQSLRGERGVIQIPDNWFTRQRYNPFFDYTYERILEWVDPE
jgi:alpha-beta hydrolase superfamily lysophospholipase